MKKQYDLSRLGWRLTGWTPFLKKFDKPGVISDSKDPEITAVPAEIPCSVQWTLRQAGLLPDWNVGLNWRECEWVENRWWVFETVLPDSYIKPSKTYRLNCLGLDNPGRIMINGREAARFDNTHLPVTADITQHLVEKDNVIRVVFELAPRWLGQFGYTSQMRDFKSRFYYTWDWTVRLVQIGIWDDIYLEEIETAEIEQFQCVADTDGSKGILGVRGRASGRVRIALADGQNIIREEEISAQEFEKGFEWRDLPVELWWPNLMGDQPLYTVTCTLLGGKAILDIASRRVGFRNISWAKNEGAPEGADPWICVVNGRPVFLQGANWVPPVINYADVTDEQYTKRIALYRELGFNFLRVWGGTILEREKFFDLCDENGIMVWQEFHLSSSGEGDCLPPEDEETIKGFEEIAESHVLRRQHHPSLIMWCGGNELCDDIAGTPIDPSQPTVRRIGEVVKRLDPTRRYVHTSASGPSEWPREKDFGKGIHWDVHGPWKPDGDLEKWYDFWTRDDSLFHSEMGAPGASPIDLIKYRAGDMEIMPVDTINPLWRLPMPWWLESGQFEKEKRNAPSLEEYIEWSQDRQAKALAFAVKSCKDKFPRCGGIVFWMGHDCFPCPANTAIIDFNGDPKPAAIAIGEIFRSGNE